MGTNDGSERRVSILRDQIRALISTYNGAAGTDLLGHAMAVLLQTRREHAAAKDRLDEADHALLQAELFYAFVKEAVVGRIPGESDAHALFSATPEPAAPDEGGLSRVPGRILHLLTLLPPPPGTARTKELVAASWRLEHPDELVPDDLFQSAFAANIRDRIRRAKELGLIVAPQFGHMQLTDAGVSAVDKSDKLDLNEDKED